MENKTPATTKAIKITYWIATGWLSLGMVATGIVQLIKMKEETEMMAHLGYPLYLLLILGAWKILGVVTILLPKLFILKEWAYAGFFFAMSGAIFSHIAVGDGGKELFGPSLLLVLTILSWYYRPANRRVVSA